MLCNGSSNALGDVSWTLLSLMVTSWGSEGVRCCCVSVIDVATLPVTLWLCLWGKICGSFSQSVLALSSWSASNSVSFLLPDDLSAKIFWEKTASSSSKQHFAHLFFSLLLSSSVFFCVKQTWLFCDGRDVFCLLSSYLLLLPLARL